LSRRTRQRSSAAARSTPKNGASDASALRFAVIDLAETRHPSDVCGYRGRVVCATKARDFAVALARQRAARGEVFIVVIDTVNGEPVFPVSDGNEPDEPRVTQSGTRLAVRTPRCDSRHCETPALRMRHTRNR